ncbi:hypothetical protein KMW28_25145 [Flammeovirga yaeyamensis]|uniref:Uncharacterized protein n=1 Tax=Flammeovirga yaeyamensis TaxID=367791 RepID=A0AAX1NCP4_9BACT|nr:hypothetical protein [Flammeovirga yaeyamensis]MBB3699421.1 hypothetical protein [Flammeovirga yaeyamensis]NMF35321.1 hypothetical protein [Flammeovirga yaeyamensis]QWG04181.1 hypothetical protein KMW28_25145 [Flammeovirga yaeyamensis]
MDLLKEQYPFEKENEKIEGLFSKVPYIYDITFEDTDTLFVRLDKDQNYFQQGYDKFLLGRWTLNNDTLFYETVNKYNDLFYKFPILIVSQEVYEINEKNKFGEYYGREYSRDFYTVQTPIAKIVQKEDTLYTIEFKEYYTPRKIPITHIYIQMYEY